MAVANLSWNGLRRARRVHVKEGQQMTAVRDHRQKGWETAKEGSDICHTGDVAVRQSSG